MSDRIQIFVTGGTFDKEYNELTGELFFQVDRRTSPRCFGWDGPTWMSRSNRS